MNILFLYEYRKQSANYNIALKLINEFEKNGVSIFSRYYYNEKTVSSESKDDEIWNHTVNSPYTQYYYNIKNNKSWNNNCFWRKLLFFVSHPRFASSFIVFKFDHLTNCYFGRRRIKQFCLNNKIDCIIAISAPHEIEKIMSNFNICIPVLLLRLDPYAFNPCYPDSEKNKRLKEERIILSRVNRLFSTNLIIRDLLNDRSLNCFFNKMVAIEFPMISETDPIRSNNNTEYHFFQKKEETTYLLHAGTFYNDIRPPQKLVSFMKELPEKYILLVAGINSADIRKYDEEIRDRIIDLGCLSSDEINSVIEDCDFLISYNNLNTNMVPSKLFECIDSGKPFINLCHSDKCPTINYVKDYDMAFTVVLDKQFNRDELISFLENTKGCKSSREQILNRYEKCTVKYVAGQIIDEFKSV